jgi:hypothetical protein
MRKLAVPFAAALLLAAGAASAATTPTATKWNDRADGFSIILPAKWYAVPRTVSAVQQTIALAKKQKLTALASEYGFYLTALGQSELKAYVFQAFLDVSPSNDPIYPQVSVQVTPKGKSRPYKQSNLAAAGRVFASSLAQNKGAKITVPTQISLPEGPAQLIKGTIPQGSGLSDGFELYLLIHKGKLYALKFDIDAAVLSQATVFRSIAEHFAFI